MQYIIKLLSAYWEIVICFVYVILHYSSQSLSRHSSHELHCHLWEVHRQHHHQQGIVLGIYLPIQLAKWRPVLLCALIILLLYDLHILGSCEFMTLITLSAFYAAMIFDTGCVYIVIPQKMPILLWTQP